jgi:hypothetical protein
MTAVAHLKVGKVGSDMRAQVRAREGGGKRRKNGDVGERVSFVGFAEFGRPSIRELGPQMRCCRTAVSAYVRFRPIADIENDQLSAPWRVTK